MSKYIRHPITGCRVSSFISEDVVWMIDPVILGQIVEEAKLKASQPGFFQRGADKNDNGDDDEPEEPPYKLEGDVAVIGMSGAVTKYPTSFGNASTLQTKSRIRDALQDDKVNKIMLHIDSPGGTASGVPELAEYIQEADQKKPVFVHGDGMMASAGYYIGAAAREVIADRNTQVGSIGTAAIIKDYSKMFENEGIKVIPIATSRFKAAGYPGTVVTDDHIGEFQRRVDDVNGYFINDVAKYRRITPEHVRGLEARVYTGQSAVDHKLVDKVMNYDQALAYVQAYKPDAASRGPAPATTQPAATQTRSPAMALTPQQLQTIRDKFPAAVQIKDDGMDVWMANTILELQQRNDSLAANQKPKLDPSLADERRKFVTAGLGQMVKDGLITQAQFTQLQELVAKDSPLADQLLQREADDSYSVDRLLAPFRNNTTAVITKQQAGDPPKPEQRNTPGGDPGAMQKAADTAISNLHASRYKGKKPEAATNN